MRHHHFDRLFFSWTVFAIAITCVMLLSYAIGQQVLRLSANDPQVEITEEVTQVLASGVSPANILPNQQVDLARSLGVYVMILDDQGKALGSTAMLDGKSPSVPLGALAYAAAHGDNRITWQPKAGVRSAVVIRPYTNGSTHGYVVAGRSLREVEKRIDVLTVLSFTAWLITLFIVAGALIVKDFITRRHKK
ncbi:hypothetical protein COV04_01190 [Candidatus Uhrbacteria bacterium CG10_big_fil_rev_8_21_14_0_10_48_11]|uniref:Uncharacterized protein n=1 Tax=Candidatus Uhrbacteria bacterium CG10_big_fil_rev_8_21_14_0_10_48_11 TaxID=1975037 RepID=A0A2M8LFA3_9BACT|nr:MAG: hypothetical protein COV04_01190 [Candidatus Uhrbacteria bacterium CG10_big_fil_rev_8_21_14_0_10_48_11]